MNKLLVLTAFLVGVFTGLLVGKGLLGKEVTKNLQKVVDRSLDKYTIDNLSKLKPQNSKVKIERVLKENKNSTSYLFSFETAGKKVTGQMNLPAGRQVSPNQKFPVVVMFRGYVDQKQYKTGDGTRKVAEVFAKAGFITIAPDFLGYGESDKEADNIFEARFQTYTTALTLLSSIDSIDKWDKKNVFLWAHSNGGQIALVVLEIGGRDYPTTLWAPLTKPFPYSILVYSDEATDSGKFLRSELSRFEETYDADLYSLTNYLDRIKAPLQIHQGTLDDAVPFWWTNSFVKELKKLDIDVKYYTYPGADHNLTPNWNTVVQRDLIFLTEHLKKT